MVVWSLFIAAVSMPLNLMGTYLTGVAISRVRPSPSPSGEAVVVSTSSLVTDTHPTAQAGEDSGQCCCDGGCCDASNCGFPPGGSAGTRAFLAVLAAPVNEIHPFSLLNLLGASSPVISASSPQVALRAALVTLFMCCLIYLNGAAVNP